MYFIFIEKSLHHEYGAFKNISVFNFLTENSLSSRCFKYAMYLVAKSCQLNAYIYFLSSMY